MAHAMMIKLLFTIIVLISVQRKNRDLEKRGDW